MRKYIKLLGSLSIALEILHFEEWGRTPGTRKWEPTFFSLADVTPTW